MCVGSLGPTARCGKSRVVKLSTCECRRCGVHVALAFLRSAPHTAWQLSTVRVTSHASQYTASRHATATRRTPTTRGVETRRGGARCAPRARVFFEHLKNLGAAEVTRVRTSLWIWNGLTSQFTLPARCHSEHSRSCHPRSHDQTQCLSLTRPTSRSSMHRAGPPTIPHQRTVQPSQQLLCTIPIPRATVHHTRRSSFPASSALSFRVPKKMLE